MQKYMVERRAVNREYAIKKLGQRCVQCGSKSNLQFDHIDKATKIIGIADMLSHGRKKLNDELKKCQLLCQSCHNKKTLKDMGWQDSRTEHGTPRSYNHCKCELCKAVHREQIYAWRRRTGRH